MARVEGFEPSHQGVMEPEMGLEPINLHQINDGLLPGDSVVFPVKLFRQVPCLTAWLYPYIM